MYFQLAPYYLYLYLNSWSIILPHIYWFNIFHIAAISYCILWKIFTTRQLNIKLHNKINSKALINEFTSFNVRLNWLNNICVFLVQCTHFLCYFHKSYFLSKRKFSFAPLQIVYMLWNNRVISPSILNNAFLGILICMLIKWSELYCNSWLQSIFFSVLSGGNLLGCAGFFFFYLCRNKSISQQHYA